MYYIAPVLDGVELIHNVGNNARNNLLAKGIGHGEAALLLLSNERGEKHHVVTIKLQLQ